MVLWKVIDSPLGDIHMAALEDGLVYCASARENGSDMFLWLEQYLPKEELSEGSNDILDQAKNQLDLYFAGKSQVLDVPLKLIGTDFRIKVWKALMEIPYGQTRTYGQVAQIIGNPKAARAIGQANNKNPISYFVP